MSIVFYSSFTDVFLFKTYVKNTEHVLSAIL